MLIPPRGQASAQAPLPVQPWGRTKVAKDQISSMQSLLQSWSQASMQRPHPVQSS
jgi:hypothetical protein